MSIDKAQFEKPLIDIIDDACVKFADQDCIVFESSSYTYAQVQALSVEIAEALAGAGFKKGMHAAVYSLNSAEAFITTLGILRAGGVWLPVNPRNSSDDNIAIIKKLGCHALFFQNEFIQVAQTLNSQLDTVLLSVNYAKQGLTNWLRQGPKKSVDIKRHPLDTITIPMTGGTTGLPKGVVLSDRNFRALTYAMCYDYAKDEGDTPVMLCAAPMTHVGGRAALTSMAAGVKFVIKRTVDLPDILRCIGQEKISHLFLPPTAIYGLLAQPDVLEHDYSNLRSLAYGSAPMALSQLKKAITVFGPVLRGGFGQTECPMKISALEQRDHFISGQLASDQRLSSVGKATVISQLGIMDESGALVANGERGEIVVKGGCVSEGYYQDPAETAKIRKNGWHLTGDIGYLDDQGFLYIVDRKKDMIISGGFNVYSAEVEKVIGSIDGVAAVAVIGVPDDKWGERVTALVQPVVGQQLTEATIIAACKHQLGSVKSPKSVDFVADFAKTAVGKIDKKSLRAQYG